MSHESTELMLFINNDSDLHRQQGLPILKNLATKKVKSLYKHPLAVKLYGYLVESGAKKYAKEYGSPDHPWHKMFDVPTRKEVAEALTNAFEEEFELGNYDHLLPKKYQKELSKKNLVPPHPRARASAHARKKGSATYTVHGHMTGRDGMSHSFWTRTGLSKSAAEKLAREQRAESGGFARVAADGEKQGLRARFEAAGRSTHATKSSTSKTRKWKTPASLKIVWSVPNSAYFALWPARGPIKDQQVLKIAGAEDMHEWLRSTYGPAYGLAGRTTSASHATKKSSRADISGYHPCPCRDCFETAIGATKGKPSLCHECTSAGCPDSRGGCEVQNNGSHHDHARKKTPGQLNREINAVLGKRVR